MKVILILALSSFAFSEFKIDYTKSTISYRGSHPFHDWEGTTSQIEINTECIDISVNCKATISAPIMHFLSGNNNRDSNMLFSVNAYKHPTVSISLENFFSSSVFTLFA